MSNAIRGRFITLEGCEGGGKTTQAKFIRKWLEERGRQVVSTREPGGSPLAEAIRGVVLQDWAEGVSPHTESLLMFAARCAHVNATIQPALANGQDVVCDRFVDSSWAFQGWGRAVKHDYLEALETMVLGDFKPDLVLVLDVDPAVGVERAKRRGGTNRFEEETIAFMQRVGRGFLARAGSAPERYVVIDANQDEQAVQDQIARVLEIRFGGEFRQLVA